jgi:NitT/TauT family transport system permease protein
MRGAAAMRTVGAPLALGVLALALWQLAVVAFDVKPFVIPSPLAIGTAFGATPDTILGSALITGANALIGLVAGSIVGILFAIVAALVKIVDQITAPLVAGLAVVPIVALAPVFYTMFGANAQTARQLIAGIAVFIPVFLNTLRGLRQVRPVHRDLLKAYGASPWQATRTVTLPGAVPFVFTGFRIASSLGVISALVAEYFGGPIDGIGRAITTAVSSSNYAVAWAYVVGSILLGLAFYCVTLGLEIWANRHRRPA